VSGIANPRWLNRGGRFAPRPPAVPDPLAGQRADAMRVVAALGHTWGAPHDRHEWRAGSGWHCSCGVKVRRNGDGYEEVPG